MKKIYEKPEAQIVEFDLKDNLMDGEGSMGTPDISTGIEGGW